jgi:iron complex transport system substrate-binding protein
VLVRMMALLAAGLSACSGQDAESVEASALPKRIVSLDVCADQFVIGLVPASRILAVSPDATESFSYVQEEAVGLATVRPVAEDVLILRPDLVVRAYGGGAQAASFFERAGVPVLEVGWANDIPSVMANIERMAEALGAEQKGRLITSEMKARLAMVNVRGGTTLYMTPGGVTTGPGSLVHEIIRTAGNENFQSRAGWSPIPLERLAYEQPDRIAASFFDSPANYPDAWSPTRHPIAKALLEDGRIVPMDGAWTACASWALVEAVEALAAEEDR